MVGVVIAEEPYSHDLVRELYPLFTANCAEIDGVEVSLELNVYDSLSESGALKMIIMRAEDRTPVGYLIFFLSPLLHDNETLVAQQDAFFIDRNFRSLKGARDLMKAAEDTARGSGASDFRQSSRSSRPGVAKLLRRGGYSKVEEIYSKRL